MFEIIKVIAEWGMKIAPIYIPLMLGFVVLNWYLSFRASRAHRKPNFKKKVKPTTKRTK